MKYEYLIKSIPAKYAREGHILEGEYGQYITEFAAQGWRFIQFVNLVNLAPNDPRIDLVFERKRREED